MLRPATTYMSGAGKPRTGGTYSRSGTIMIAPPMPSMPEKKAPVKPKTASTSPNSKSVRELLRCRLQYSTSRGITQMNFAKGHH